ncbi:MAG: hypothetical protein JXA96_15965 [Sedimentisphaerales bacterium]|nr:hypothetical protein [Sedimentisphaerales bacterium]
MFRKVILIYIISGLCSVTLSAEISPSKLLEKWQNNQKAFEKIIISGETREQYLDSTTKSIRFGCLVTEMRRDGTKIDLVIKRYPDLKTKDEQFKPRERENLRLIWDDQKYYNINFITRSTQDFLTLVTVKNQEDPQIMGEFCGKPLFGLFFGDWLPFSTILTESETITLRETTETINDSKCFVIDAVTSHGKFSIWIDPEHGYNIAKAEVRKTENDIYYGKPLKDAYPQTRPEGLPNSWDWERLPPLVSYSFNINNVKFDKINNIWVPMEGQWEYIEEDENGKIKKANFSYKAQAIDLNPDFKTISAFIPDIPEGTSINIPGGKSTYTWKGGKIVDIYGFEVDIDNLEPPSLIGKVLPDMTEFNISFDSNLIKDKMLLLCFWEMEQRPSRNCIQMLIESSQELFEENVYIAFIHAGPVERQTLVDGLEKNGIQLPVGIIEKSLHEIERNWGVRSLPWLILTDKNHIVSAEGFGYQELNEKLNEIKKHNVQ